MTLKRIQKSCLLLVIALLAVACSNDDNQADSDNTAAQPVVSLLLSVDGLGDRGFNDSIFAGLCRVYEQYGAQYQVAIDHLVPASDDEAVNYLTRWFADDSKTPRLLVVGNDALASLVVSHPEWRCNANSQVLLLDTHHTLPGMYTRYISLYGGSHLGGQVVKALGVERAAVVKSNIYDVAVQESAQAFIDGFRYAGGVLDTSRDVFLLADQGGAGYTEADSLFRLSYHLDSQGYRFVFPVCGGSSQGIFRYTRQRLALASENPFYTCGMDADQQNYSRRVAFSLVKDYSRCLLHFVGHWLAHQSQPLYAWYGLDSEYMNLIIADGYEFMVTPSELETMRQQALEAEQKQMENFAHD